MQYCYNRIIVANNGETREFECCWIAAFESRIIYTFTKIFLPFLPISKVKNLILKTNYICSIFYISFTSYVLPDVSEKLALFWVWLWIIFQMSLFIHKFQFFFCKWILLKHDFFPWLYFGGLHTHVWRSIPKLSWNKNI